MNIQTVNFKDVSFINVTSPSEIELKYLKKNLSVSQLHLDDYTNKTQVPKIEVAKNYTLIVLDFPICQNGLQSTTKEEKSGKGPIGNLLNIPQATLSSIPLSSILPSGSLTRTKRIFSTQVDFFIGKDYLAVVHDGSLTPINDIFSLCQKTLHNRQKFIGNGPVFLAYSLVDVLVDTCFPVINDISSNIDRIDRQLEQTPSQDTLEDISVIRRNIVVFHTMVKPILPIFKEIEEGKYKQLNGEMQPYWSNITDHLQKIWDRLEDNQELIEGIAESNESLLTSRTNEVVKLLTIFSAIILPLNLIASMYGMNVNLPFAHDFAIFTWVAIGMIALTLSMLVVFKTKRWF